MKHSLQCPVFPLLPHLALNHLKGPQGMTTKLAELNPDGWVHLFSGLLCVGKKVLWRTHPSSGQWCYCSFLTRWAFFPFPPPPDNLHLVQPSTPGPCLQPSLKAVSVLYITSPWKTCQGSSDLGGKCAQLRTKAQSGSSFRSSSAGFLGLFQPHVKLLADTGHLYTLYFTPSVS